MSLAETFAGIALGFSDAIGGPFVEAVVITPGTPVLDTGGDIVTAGSPLNRTCRAQADSATEAMRRAQGFADGDIRILVLSASLDGSITTDDRVEISSGPFAGTYSVESVARDPANVGFELRGRRG